MPFAAGAIKGLTYQSEAARIFLGPNLILDFGKVPYRPRRGDRRGSGREEARGGAADAAGEHHGAVRRACQAAARARRPQALHRLAGRPARNGAQFQILPPGNRQDRRHLERSRRLPRHLFLTPQLIVIHLCS